MKMIEKGLGVFKESTRSEIIENHCPKDMNKNLEDMDAYTFTFSDVVTGTERGCRGVTCEECWNKEIKKVRL